MSWAGAAMSGFRATIQTQTKVFRDRSCDARVLLLWRIGVCAEFGGHIEKPAAK